LTGYPDIRMDDSELRDETYRLLRQVPAGRVTTYGALAVALGAKEASRLVGQYMATNPYAPKVPCHRVVHSDGRLGRYSSPRGPDQKAEMLGKEGVRVEKGRIADFDKVVFRDFSGPGPLKQLRDYQRSLVPGLVLEDRREPHANLVAFDVAYEDEGAFAAGALYGLKEGKPGPTVTVHAAVTFPYIPTFLGFREIPAIKAVFGALLRKPDLLLVDGNGTLHPRGMGIASMAGIELDTPTIGVAKSLLCGEVLKPPVNVGDSSEVILEGKPRGHALRISPSAKGVVYVSPGHLVSHERAVALVRSLVVDGQVEPLRRAHLAARAFATSFKSGGPVADSA
jgi:deoxyribonuclease V